MYDKYSKAPTHEAKFIPYYSCKVLAVSSSILGTNSAVRIVGWNLRFFLAPAFSKNLFTMALQYQASSKVTLMSVS
jgi:hypothetical protein